MNDVYVRWNMTDMAYLNILAHHLAGYMDENYGRSYS
jgi:hypothetical protein